MRFQINSDSEGLRRISILNWIYFSLMPVGIFNDAVIMEDIGSAIFNLVFTSLVFGFSYMLIRKNKTIKLISTILYGILFLFSIMGLAIFASSALTYILFTYHLIYSGFSLSILTMDGDTLLVFNSVN